MWRRWKDLTRSGVFSQWATCAPPQTPLEIEHWMVTGRDTELMLLQRVLQHNLRICSLLAGESFFPGDAEGPREVDENGCPSKKACARISAQLRFDLCAFYFCCAPVRVSDYGPCRTRGMVASLHTDNEIGQLTVISDSYTTSRFDKSAIIIPLCHGAQACGMVAAWPSRLCGQFRHQKEFTSFELLCPIGNQNAGAWPRQREHSCDAWC